MKNQLYILFMGLTLYNCDSSINKFENISFRPSMLNYEHEVVGSITLKLDSLTGFYHKYLEIVELDGREYLVLLNGLVNKIQAYDTESGEMVWSLQLEEDGPNGVGQNAGAFYIENFNEIYVFDRWTARLSLVDSLGHVTKYYRLIRNDIRNNGDPFPIVTNSSPIIKIDNSFYLSGIIPGGWRGMVHEDRTMIKLNLQDSSLSFWLNRPEVNDTFNWGNDLLNYVHFDYDRIEKRFIISYPNYDSLITYNNDDKSINSHKTISIFFNKLTPLSNDPDWRPSKELLDYYYFSTPRYWSVYYDPYKKMTYRITSIPNPQEVVNQGIREMKHTIVILDPSMKVIGEAYLDEEIYDPRMIFINKNGFHIASNEKFKTNEDELVFDRIRFIPKNN